MSDDMTLGETAISLAIMAPILGFVMWLNSESDEDKATKPAVIEQIVENALDVCSNNDSAVVTPRMQDILKNVKTKHLRTLRDNNVSVCLDTRLPDQKNGFFDREMQGIYYSGVLSSDSGSLTSIVSLWDNGQPVSEDGFFKKDASDRGAEMVTSFAKAVSKHGLPKQGEHKIAGLYTYSCGKNCTRTEIRWKSIESFDRDTVRKNPLFERPPTKMDW